MSLDFRISCDRNCLFHAASVSLVGNQLLASTLKNLCCIELYQNSKYYATLDYIRKKADENLTHVYISEVGLFRQCLSDEALVIYSSSKSRKIAVEEDAAVIATNLKWSSFKCVLSLAGLF